MQSGKGCRAARARHSHFSPGLCSAGSGQLLPQGSENNPCFPKSRVLAPQLHMPWPQTGLISKETFSSQLSFWSLRGCQASQTGEDASWLPGCFGFHAESLRPRQRAASRVGERRFRDPLLHKASLLICCVLGIWGCMGCQTPVLHLKLCHGWNLFYL